MASFNSIWAIKSDERVAEGNEIAVKLKSGATKQVRIEKFLYSQEYKDGRTAYFYLPVRKSED